MIATARLYVYLMAIVLAITGFTELVAPTFLGSRLGLMVGANAGVSELRGLMGGGFLAFGVCLLLGLRRTSLRPGLLLSMAITMGFIVFGRLTGVVIDGFAVVPFTAMVAEAALGLACWAIYAKPSTR